MKKALSTSLFLCFLLTRLYGQAIHLVNSTNDNDDGVCNGAHCSLREALNASNTNIGPDSIEFNIPGPGPHVIAVNTVLPFILDSFLVIDGTTQPGNLPMSGLIIIDGSALLPGSNHGLVIYRRWTEIYGLQIQNFPADGIQLFGLPDPFLSNIIIGAPAKGNVIILNGSYGIEGPIDRNVSIQANYVGTDLQFNSGLGNAWDGVFVDVLSGANVTIGGSRSLNQQNYLCSNRFSGLRVVIDDALQFLPGFNITGNVIGTDNNGTRNLGNLGFTFGGGMSGGGISIMGIGPVMVGGSGGLANIIAFNYTGIYTTTDDRKTVLENFFYCNSYKGIHLGNNANAGILPPAILCLQGNILIGVAPPGMMVDVYLHNNTICPDAPCQGLTILGRVTTDAGGSWNYDVSAWPGAQFTALAQDALGNSSEFAACILDPNVIAMNGGPYCPGDSIFLFSMLDTAVGNVTFEWFGPGGYTSFVQNPIDATLPGIYTVVADIMGCGADTAFTEVFVYPLATDTITVICLGDSIVVNGTIYDETNWFGEELLVGAAQTGCDSLVVINLDFHFPIIGRILSTIPRACSGDTVGYWFFLIGGNGPYDVIYTTGIGQPDTLFSIYDGHGDTLVVSTDVHFAILDIITNETICEPTILTSDSILVSELSMSPLVTDYYGFGVSCFGENDGMITLNVTGGVGTIDYDWNLAALTGDIASQLSAGTYSVTVTDEAGCSLVFDTLVTQPTMFESITRTEVTTCPGVNDGVIFVDAILGARGPVSYSLNGSPFLPVTSLPLQIPNLSPGVVNLVLRDSTGCIDDLSLFVPLGETPGIDLGTERSILSGDSVLLNFNTTLEVDLISWSPDSVLSCSTCPATYAFPTESQYILLTLTDSSGCSVTDSILILVFVPKKVYIPTVFSPNNDQINDVFYLQANDFAREVEYMTIADRWGDVVFERTHFPINDPAFGWDGSLDGKMMFPAVFTYLARILFSDGEIVPYSGTVTLIR
ncbi:MAG TPA: gliding motility-associated C-terminal domain-containing protein [Saprospiraceae bacterium]|nr:gliding motility-associated C-terminal domain-containing protein [Saprospiraceae bacterium]